MLKAFNYRVLVTVAELADTDPAYAAAKRAGIELIRDHRVREEGGVDRGTVIDIGPTIDDGLKLDLQIGDEVFFARYAGKKLEDPYTKAKCLALNDEDIVAKIVKEDKND